MKPFILKTTILLLFLLTGFEAYTQGKIPHPDFKKRTESVKKEDKGSKGRGSSSTSKNRKGSSKKDDKRAKGQEPSAAVVETFTVNGVTFDMVKVEGGSYSMGSNEYDRTQPVHTERVGTFYIGKTEVTQKLWTAVMGENPSNFRGENLPVEKVSWDDCQEFIERLGRITGRKFRLPTEAEWEYAARGGNKSQGYTYSGSNDVNRVAWNGENSDETHPVAQKLDNELGIYDMSGNVWEWCSDNYSSNYSSPRNSSDRVSRGGGWGNTASDCCVAYRNSISPGSRYRGLGLRLALSSTSKTQTESSKEVGKVTKGQESSASVVESFTVNGVTFEMVKVEGGSYMMGSNDGESNEQPVHSETVGTFYIGKTEVTQKLWTAVMGDNPSHFRGENLPVEQVSWDDCQEFVERLSRLTGRKFRLPTEAEWEYAARGGNKSRGYTYSGSNDVNRVAWYDENSGDKTHPVAQKLDNELGIYDMSGNVWEWCSDNYSDNYSSPRDSSNRVLRGGSYFNSASGCRVAGRYYISPGKRYFYLGLRLVL